jgi:hypothetical protein
MGRCDYNYISYAPEDHEYFGCRRVVEREWEYIHKRRAAQETDEIAENEESSLASMTLEGRDEHGRVWNDEVELVARIHRTQVKDATEEGIKQQQQIPAEPPPDLTGIALSGGGIRSASFALGVLQALAYAGWLKKLDYLSTVSGGSYIGCSLSWLLHRKWKGESGEEIAYGLERRNFPYSSYPIVGMEEPGKTGASGKAVYKGRMLRHLRQHARYLTPGDGINLMSLLAVTLRNALFSVFVYGGLLALLLVLTGPYLFGKDLLYIVSRQQLPLVIVGLLSNNNAMAFAWLLGIAFLSTTILYVIFVTRLPRRVNTGYSVRYMYERWMGYLLVLLFVAVIIGALPKVYEWMGHPAKAAQASELHVSGTVSDLTVSGAGQVTIDSTTTAPTQMTLTATVQPVPVNAANASVDSGIIERLKNKIDNLSALAGSISTLLGAIASIWAYIQGGKGKKWIPTSVIVAVGMVALIFGLLLLTYSWALCMRGGNQDWSSSTLDTDRVVVLSVILAVFMLFPNLNYLSLLVYYRDRLMETFTPELPGAINVKGPIPGDVKSADSTHLFELIEKRDVSDLGPYHIINTNIVLVSSRIPKFRARGGDSFVLTPLYCGSNATGWCETSRNECSPFHGVTLPTAMAISGAAINSNAGSGGEGVTRSPMLSFLMGFFNFRLGYWVGNPKPEKDRLRDIAVDLDRPFNLVHMLVYRMLAFFSWGRGGSRPNAIYPGLMEIFLRKNLDENSRLIQLSDGGHFENMGLYELVRRRLKLIIVCDGTADPNYGFKDLANAMEKVRVDFGALIRFDCSDMAPLLPSQEVKVGANGEQRLSYSKKGYLLGSILYEDGEEGVLLYINTTFFPSLSADLYSYRMEHKEYPDQPTSDQLFDEMQFEAYRELGYQNAHRMMCDPEVVDNPVISRRLGAPHIGCKRNKRGR